MHRSKFDHCIRDLRFGNKQCASSVLYLTTLGFLYISFQYILPRSAWSLKVPYLSQLMPMRTFFVRNQTSLNNRFWERARWCFLQCRVGSLRLKWKKKNYSYGFMGSTPRAMSCRERCHVMHRSVSHNSRHVTLSTSHQGAQIWAHSGSDWPQMGQIRDFFRLDCSTFWLGEPKCTEI